MTDNDDRPHGGWPVQAIIGVVMTLALTGVLSWAGGTISASANSIHEVSRQVAVLQNEMNYMKAQISELRVEVRELRKGGTSR